MTETRIAAMQLPLALNLKESPGFDLFVVGDNIEALQQARRMARGISHQNLYFWGQPGCGISHLLQAACILADENRLRVAYVPLADHAALDPGMLENLDSLDLVCLDDIDHIAGNEDWEQAVLHLYNRLREAGVCLLLGAHSSPQAAPLQLPDLKSRMSWDLVYHIKALRDADKIDALQRRAEARGFQLPREVAEYVVNRTLRDMRSLLRCLDEMENASLAAQRKLTIPFVKTILEIKS